MATAVMIHCKRPMKASSWTSTGDCGVCVRGPDGFAPDLILANPRRYSVVSGWALDSGVNANDSGVGYVELLIDRALYNNNKIDCFYAPETGGLTNCYGLRRLDIANIYPSLRDSLHSGFRYVLDISQLINCGLYAPGHHTLSIRAGDQFQTRKPIAAPMIVAASKASLGSAAEPNSAKSSSPAAIAAASLPAIPSIPSMKLNRLTHQTQSKPMRQ